MHAQSTAPLLAHIVLDEAAPLSMGSVSDNWPEAEKKACGSAEAVRVLALPP